MKRAGTVAIVATAFVFMVGSTALARCGNPIRASLNVVGPQDGGGEPSTAIAKDGTIYVSAPGDEVEFYRSTNHGQTWTEGADADSQSGDTSVNVDTSGAVYQTNLNGITLTPSMLQVDVYKSFNKGDSWPQHATSTLCTVSMTATCNPFFVDRQWIDAYIPTGQTTSQAHVSITYHDFGPGTMWVQTSTDGGQNFGPPVDIINDPQALEDSYCNTIPGGIKYVPAGLPHAGRAYVVWLAGDVLNAPTGCNYSMANGFHDVWSAYSDDPTDPTSWHDQLIYDAGPGLGLPPVPGRDGSQIFADLTLDNRGNPYVAWSMNLVNHYDIWVEASFDGGTTWNGSTTGNGQPYRANTDIGTHYFPTIAAGNPGQVDVAYLATPFIVPALPNGKPDETTDQNADWYVWVSQSKDIGPGTLKPHWKTTRLTRVPMHHGDICTLGIACVAPMSNRNLLDFIDIAVDPNGFFHIAYTDDHNYPTLEGGGALVMANQTSGSTIGHGGH